jgi:hypothetical protein
MHLVGRLSNPPNQSTMTVLEAYPAGVPAQTSRARSELAAPKPLRLGNGVVQRSVIRALLEADRPIDVGEAHTAVEAHLGHPVSWDSVSSCLSTGVRGARPRFERVGRGRYRLNRVA